MAVCILLSSWRPQESQVLTQGHLELSQCQSQLGRVKFEGGQAGERDREAEKGTERERGPEESSYFVSL